MRLPEPLQYLRIGDDFWIEYDEHDLVVAGRPGADLLVGRVRRIAAGIADGRDIDARRLPEDALRAPETSKTEQRRLRALRIGPLQLAAVDEMRRGRGDGAVSAGQGVLRAGHDHFLGVLVE